MKKGDYDPLAFGNVDFGKAGVGRDSAPPAAGASTESAPEDMLFESGSAPASDTFQAAGPQFAEAEDVARSAYGDDDTPAGFDEGAGAVDDLLSATAITPQGAFGGPESAELVHEVEGALPQDEEVEAGISGAFEASTHPMGEPATSRQFLMGEPVSSQKEPEAEQPLEPEISESEPIPSGASLYRSMAAEEAEAEPEAVVESEAEGIPPWVQKDRAAPRAAPRTRPNSDARRVDILQLPRERPPRSWLIGFGLPLVVFGAGASGGAWIGLLHQNPIMGGVVFVLGCVGSMFCRVLLR